MNDGQWSRNSTLEHPQLSRENQMDWQEAVGKVSRVIDDTCKENE